jgi:hypothetical protein
MGPIALTNIRHTRQLATALLRKKHVGFLSVRRTTVVIEKVVF